MNRFWGLQDSSITFCEKDYRDSKYIAEYYNTISGLSYSIVGLWFYRSSISKETVYSLIGLGLSTALFHGTMRYYGQIADELSMLILSFYLIKEIHMDLPIQALGVILSIYFMAYDMFPIFFILFMSAQVYLYFLQDYLVIYISNDDKWQWQTSRMKGLIQKKNYASIIGGICWVVDIFFCEYMTESYFHAAWHIFTAIALYYGCECLLTYKIINILKSD